MRVFQEVTKADLEPAKNLESYSSHLQRSTTSDSIRIRQFIELWFRHYPAEGRADIKGRLTSNEDSNFFSAFFELYLHEVLTGLGCKVETHPDLPGSGNRPDFLVRSPFCTDFYCEARVVTCKSDDVGAENRLNAFLDQIDRVKSDKFDLDLNIDGAPSQNLSGKRVRGELTKWLDGLDAPEKSDHYRGALDDLPTWDFGESGLSIRFSPIPHTSPGISSTDSRRIGMTNYGHDWMDPVQAVTKALEEKSAKYGHLDKAYVIALNILSRRADLYTVSRVLLGEAAGTGLYGNRSAPRKKRVSGILAGIRIDPWTIEQSDLCFFRHFDPNHRIGSEFDTLSQVETDLELSSDSKSGQKAASFLRLPGNEYKATHSSTVLGSGIFWIRRTASCLGRIF